MSIVTRNIKRFSIDGVAVDGEAILRIRKELEDRLIEDMRERGYVPVIDILPQLYWEYNKDQENFSYTISVYGVYLGKKKSKQILGVLDNKYLKVE
jgi:hypothetical protein